MKPFYNKARCHAAKIISFSFENEDAYEMWVDIEGGPLTKRKIHGGWNLIRFEEYPKRRQPMIEHRPDNFWLIERYDMSMDEMKYSVVEDAVFQEQFYPDYPPQLVEGHSFERPRKVAAG